MKRGSGKPHNKATGVFASGKWRGRCVGCEPPMAPGRPHRTLERRLGDDRGYPGMPNVVVRLGGAHTFCTPPQHHHHSLLDVPSSRPSTFVPCLRSPPPP